MTTASRAAVPSAPTGVHRISVVVPVYQGEHTLAALAAEIVPLTRGQTTPRGRAFVVGELILVHDVGPDASHRVIQSLAEQHPFVTPVWLARNFGQHPATLAGMASSSGDWVVTMDEDGQHDPTDIGKLLDDALDGGASLVYARPTNPPPHGWLRNLCSRLAKSVFGAFLGNRQQAVHFNSYRLVEGEVARSLAAYCGHGVYLDVALSWVVGRTAATPVRLRQERGRRSGYTFGKLLAHLWRLAMTSGTKPLRIISSIGVLSVVVSAAVASTSLYQKLTYQVPVAGWTSLIIVVCFFSGAILFSLGVIAEYLGMALTMAMGKPLYLVVSKPHVKDPPR
jgi:glycosyltransferase involved in cell wall biosynthesis